MLCCGIVPSAEALQYFDRLLVSPDDSYGAKYCTFIDALVSGGVWSRLDGLYVFATFTEQTYFSNFSFISHQNLISSLYPGEINGAANFLVNRGWLGTGGFDTIKIRWSPSMGINYQQNDACVFGWNLTATKFLQEFWSTQSADVGLLPYYDTTNRTEWRINQAAYDFVTNTLGGSDGLWVVNRTSANATSMYRNGVLSGTSTTASQAPTTNFLYCPTGNYRAAIVGFGASLSGGQITALYNACRAYLVDVGAL